MSDNFAALGWRGLEARLHSEHALRRLRRVRDPALGHLAVALDVPGRVGVGVAGRLPAHA